MVAVLTLSMCESYADDMELAFAGMISTSNHIDSDIITISVDAPCLWITCLRAVT